MLENSGTFDLDAEMTICGSGFGICELQFTKGTDVRARRFPRILSIVPVVLIWGCDSITGLFNDEPEHWAHTEVGYPFTAYLAEQDSVQLRSGEWIAPPDSVALRVAAQGAIERWSLALSATDVRGHVWRSALHEPWRIPIAPGDTLTGFHVVLFSEQGPWAWNLQSVSDPSSGRPIVGTIGISPHLTEVADGEGLEAIIAHEIGHALGFGWSFDEERILALVNARAGSTVATRLPVTGSHWEECMRPDLMTSTAQATGRGNPPHISNLTIDAMPYRWRYNDDDLEKVHTGAPPVCWREER